MHIHFFFYQELYSYIYKTKKWMYGNTPTFFENAKAFM